MPNLHTPERGEGESFTDYQARRQASRKAAAALERGPSQDPLPAALAALPGAWRRFWLGQHTNPAARPWRAAKALIGARQARRMRLEDKRLYEDSE